MFYDKSRVTMEEIETIYANFIKITYRFKAVNFNDWVTMK